MKHKPRGKGLTKSVLSQLSLDFTGKQPESVLPPEGQQLLATFIQQPETRNTPQPCSIHGQPVSLQKIFPARISEVPLCLIPAQAGRLNHLAQAAIVVGINATGKCMAEKTGQ